MDYFKARVNRRDFKGMIGAAPQNQTDPQIMRILPACWFTGADPQAILAPAKASLHGYPMTAHATTLPKTPTFDLGGRRALVVGASSGIGLGAAVALARAGARVTLGARHLAPLTQLSDALAQEGLRAETCVMDLSDVEDMQDKVRRLGLFDILLNSAGLARHARADLTTPDDFDAVMAVNLRGAYFVTQAVANGLLAAGKPGSLINISSQMGHVGGPERAVYCASKFALEGFTKAMAIDWGAANIRVNTICPTFIRTPLTEPTFADPNSLKWVQEKISLPRTGVVSDVLGAVLYLASDASGMVTGSALMIDGGWTAG